MRSFFGEYLFRIVSVGGSRALAFTHQSPYLGPMEHSQAIIRPYRPSAREACIAIFRSNLPKYFAPEEEKLFTDWLDKPGLQDFFVLEAYGQTLACGGFYALEAERQVRLAWGMVHAGHHGRGYGSRLTRYRLELMRRRYPTYTLGLSTSQHTFRFYEKQGYRTTEIVHNGFGPGLDKYLMEIS